MPFIDHMQRNRFECKYIIDERCACGVRDFIRGHLVRDEHARARLAWAYPIYSVYLDSPSLELFNATVCGHKNRFKLRARYYDNKPASPVFFEIKRRMNDVIMKSRAAVRRASVQRLFAGAAPQREDLLDHDDPGAFSVLREFCQLRASLGAAGRTLVTYSREAWNARDNDAVRVTFDRRIAGAWYDNALPSHQALAVNRPWVYPSIDNGHGVVLELKFTGCYPRWMEQLASTFNLYRVCMAKYVSCVQAVGPRRHGVRGERLVARAPLEALV
ncbi:MAG: hypothetical protein JWN51_859 [Phycisphaerales bacterium]|nr:hypothetical protein [Phycisphaerales bacterium]